MTKLKTTVGVTVGIFNASDKLLLRKRVEHDSITNTDYAGNWELPVVAVQETTDEIIPYNYLCLELRRGILRELDVLISVNPMPAFYPVMFKGPQGYDLAMITPLQSKDIRAIEPGRDIKGEKLFVSPHELNDLAKEFISLTEAKKQGLPEAKGLLSGFGKRQHCMALKVFEVSCLNTKYQSEAIQTLLEIQKGWRR